MREFKEWLAISEHPVPKDTRVRLYFEKSGQLYGTFDGHKFELENTFAPMTPPQGSPTYWQPIEATEEKA